MTTINLQSENLIECMIKRAGGTDVPFGFSNRKKTVYRFRPIDSTDPESPHVADVTNDEHYERFISIAEAYRPYSQDEYEEPATLIPSSDPQNNYDPSDYNDLLSVDLNTVSNDWLANFSKLVLKISPTSKAKLAEYASTTYELTLDTKTMTANEMIRSIAIERKKEERNADEAAKGE
ncbi:hypothetical protein KTN00_12185 [Acinetobacter soli]|uniref:hypothetical protein n=1 Tax=Acinetobacter soli TaxID=487316 RepID=UPI001C451405|nr:hypothetical protein [Acinetobacter soli]MBV6551774.1 hypothetical protein [Acinetobacter soli]